MRIVRLVHPVNIRIFQLDLTKCVFEPNTNSVLKTVYKDTPLEIKAQVNRGNNQAVVEFNSSFVLQSSMYFLAYTDDVFDVSNHLRINVGDFVKEVFDLKFTFPVNVFITSIEPVANYDRSYLVKLVSESRDIANPKKQDGSSVRANGVDPTRRGMVF